jgi:hypothetical protein
MGSTKTNNEKLREIVASTRLSEAVTLTIFNRGLGINGYSNDAWRALLASHDSPKFIPLDDHMLEHAEQAFENLKLPGWLPPAVESSHNSILRN